MSGSPEKENDQIQNYKCYRLCVLIIGSVIQPMHLLFVCPCPALLYELKVPRWDFQTGRQLRTSPLYDRLDTQGARWMEKHGFERPKYFVPPGKGTNH